MGTNRGDPHAEESSGDHSVPWTGEPGRCGAGQETSKHFFLLLLPLLYTPHHEIGQKGRGAGVIYA